MNLYTLGRVVAVHANGTIEYARPAVGSDHFCRVDPQFAADSARAAAAAAAAEADADADAARTGARAGAAATAESTTSAAVFGDAYGARWPLLARARPLEVWVNSGELLYLPRGWFHLVSSLPGTHTAVNFWFRDAAAGPT